jgi:hypothetical protein
MTRDEAIRAALGRAPEWPDEDAAQLAEKFRPAIEKDREPPAEAGADAA